MVPFPRRRVGSVPELDSDLSVDDRLVRAHLRDICASREFRLSPRLARFIEYTVGKTLEGRAQDIKEYAIGIEVYERGEEYNPKVDSIVRSEAVRLRQRLRAYYASEGAAERLRIIFPKGSYVPRFELRERSEPVITIAVLPFANVGGSENQFFSDGLTEELIASFGRVPVLRVVARSSCFQFQGKAIDVREAGRLLNASWVLDGSVRCLDGRLRVTAQLIEVASGLHLWSDVFDRPAGHLLTIQNDLAYAILDALKLPGSRMASVPDDAETHLLIVQARHFWRRYSIPDVQRSCALYERALARSPRSARAWAGLAASLNFLAHRGFGSLSNTTRARAAVQKALEIDSKLADAHAVNALLLAFNERNWADAEDSLRRAVELAPWDAGTLQVAAVCLMPIGKFQDSLALLRRAAELDPIACTIQMDIGILFRLQGQSETAIAQCRAALDLDPNHREAEWQLGLALQQARRFAEALSCFGRAAGRSEEELPTLGTIGNCYAEYGRKDIAFRMLRKLESAQDCDPATILHGRALIHAALHETQEALACLENCAQLRSSRLSLLPYDWRFGEMGESPRFQALLKDLGFSGC